MHAADVHVAAAEEDRLGAVAVVGVQVNDGHALGAGLPERLRGDRRVVQIARAAVAGGSGVMARWAAQRVRGARAAGH